MNFRQFLVSGRSQTSFGWLFFSGILDLLFWGANRVSLKSWFSPLVCFKIIMIFNLLWSFFHPPSTPQWGGGVTWNCRHFLIDFFPRYLLFFLCHWKFRTLPVLPWSRGFVFYLWSEIMVNFERHLKGRWHHKCLAWRRCRQTGSNKWFFSHSKMSATLTITDTALN